MRIKHQVSFNGNSILEVKLSKIGIPLNITDNLVGRFVRFTIYENDVLWQAVSELLFDFKIATNVGTDFDKEDFERANWFMLNVREYGFPQPQANFGYLKASFDLSSYCPYCGVGKRQNAPIRFKSDISTKYEIFGLNWLFDEVFVSENVKQIFLANKVTGVTYANPIVHNSCKNINDYYQIDVKDIIPKGVDDFNLDKELCDNHQHPVSLDSTKYNLPQRGALTIALQSFENAPDIVKTSEWFGAGGSAFRLLIISKKVRDIIIKEKWKGIVLTPVFHNQI